MKGPSEIEAAGTRLRNAVMDLQRIQEQAEFRVVDVYAEPDVQAHQRHTLRSREPGAWGQSWCDAIAELGEAKAIFEALNSSESQAVVV
jgi:hypothetical protein